MRLLPKSLKAISLTLTLSVFALFGGSMAIAQVQGGPAEGNNADNIIQKGLCGGSGLSLSNSGCSDVQLGNPQGALNNFITRIVNLFSVIVGIVAVVMIIIGGFRYIISGGDSSNVSDAKNTILYAIIGLVIAAMAQFIVRFILSQATGLGGS